MNKKNLQTASDGLSSGKRNFLLLMPSILSHRTCTKNWVMETGRVAALCWTDAATLALLDFTVGHEDDNYAARKVPGRAPTNETHQSCSNMATADENEDKFRK